MGGSPANAGDTGFDPWSGKIEWTEEQLGPQASTTEPKCATTPEACVPGVCILQPEKPPQWEVCALQHRVTPARCN